MLKELKQPGVFAITLAAAGVLMVTMGARQTIGLFVSPINTSTGVGIAAISFALAVAQLTWGAVQPLAGAAADRWGPFAVLTAGVVLLAVGTALTPLLGSELGLLVTQGLLVAIGSGAGSFSVLIGAAALRMSPEARGTASGVINAGGSLGQFVFAPVAQRLIQWLGWMGAMYALAVMWLAALPLIGKVAKGVPAHAVQALEKGGSLRRTLRDAVRNPDFLLLNAGFFTCGFHIAFLTTHLPTEIGLCGLAPTVASTSLALIGLANIFGSVWVGHLVNVYRSKMILAAMYASRAVLIGWYLLMPPEAWVFYVFALGLGATWLATVPPTASLVAKLYDVRYLGTLFGVTLFTHQIGGFLGAWLGGVAVSTWGSYAAMWWADIALAVLAAAINLPIREARLGRPLARA